MKTVAFILTMPGVGSWNGKWSGEGNLYALTRRLNDGIAERITVRQFSYGWSDGWRAAVDCRIVTSSEARKITKQSKGFCGYEWMVDSIILRDCIKADHEISEVTV